MLDKAFSIANFSWKDNIVLFFSCLLIWNVIISFKFHFIFCVILSVGIFFCSCLNKFLSFHILFNMDVFLIIISFRILFSVFIAFKPKMFCIGLFSELGFSFLIMGSNVFHSFFLFLQLWTTCIIVSLYLLHLSHTGDILFLFLALSYVFWLIYNILCSNL